LRAGLYGRGRIDDDGSASDPPSTPVYPITVRWPDDVPDVYDNPNDLACNLEWFDSEDPAEPIEVVDGLGRPVRLEVEKLEIIACELKCSAP
jgi:hypothetical protein